MIDYRQVQYKTQSCAKATTDGAFVAAPASGRKIRLLSVQCVPAATPAATLAFNSKGSGAGTLITPAYAQTAATLLNPSAGYGGLAETNPGEALTYTTGAGTNASDVTISYVVI